MKFIWRLQVSEARSGSLTTANATIDQLVRKFGQQQKVDMNALAVCIEKQDATAVNRSRREGDAMGVEATPTLFINGAKTDGAVPLEFILQMIDDALVAQGKTSPAREKAVVTTSPEASSKR